MIGDKDQKEFSLSHSLSFSVNWALFMARGIIKIISVKSGDMHENLYVLHECQPTDHRNPPLSTLSLTTMLSSDTRSLL